MVVPSIDALSLASSEHSTASKQTTEGISSCFKSRCWHITQQITCQALQFSLLQSLTGCKIEAVLAIRMADSCHYSKVVLLLRWLLSEVSR